MCFKFAEFRRWEKDCLKYSPGVVRRWNWALHAKGTYSGTGSKGVGRLEKCGGEGRSPKTNDCRQVSATSLGLEVPRPEAVGTLRVRGGAWVSPSLVALLQAHSRADCIQDPATLTWYSRTFHGKLTNF